MITSRDVFTVSLVGLALAAGLLWLGLPRFGAQSIALPGAGKVERLLRGQPLPRREIGDLADSRERALRWAPDPALSFELSEIYRTLWRTSPPSGARAAAVLTRDVTVRDLAARPLQARAWWRLALADYTIAGRRPTGRSGKALSMSLAMQENAMSLVPARLGLLLRHWQAFTPAEREVVKAQVPIAWRYDPGAVVATAGNDTRRAMIRAALIGNPEAAAAFERRLAVRRSE